MAKKKNTQESSNTAGEAPVGYDELPAEVVVKAAEPVKPVQAAPAKPRKKSAVKVQAKQEKKMNFDRYARRKGIKATHIPGMRAYTKNPRIPRTMAEWDKFFENY